MLLLHFSLSVQKKKFWSRKVFRVIRASTEWLQKSGKSVWLEFYMLHVKIKKFLHPYWFSMPRKPWLIYPLSSSNATQKKNCSANPFKGERVKCEESQTFVVSFKEVTAIATSWPKDWIFRHLFPISFHDLKEFSPKHRLVFVKKTILRVKGFTAQTWMCFLVLVLCFFCWFPVLGCSLFFWDHSFQREERKWRIFFFKCSSDLCRSIIPRCDWKAKFDW